MSRRAVPSARPRSAPRAPCSTAPAERFGLKPRSLAADSAYGSAENLACLVKQRGIAPHIPVFDKSNRTDGTFSRSDFVFDRRARSLHLPGRASTWCSSIAPTRRRAPASPMKGRGIYRASKRDCDAVRLSHAAARTRRPARSRATSTRTPATWPERLPAHQTYERSRHRRKKVEMLFAHLKRILRLGRLRLRGPCGARDEFLLAATAQNLRKLAKLRPMTALA